VQLIRKKGSCLLFEILVHQLDTIKVAFVRKLIGRGDLNHPIQHPSSQQSVDFVVGQKQGFTPIKSQSPQSFICIHFAKQLSAVFLFCLSSLCSLVRLVGQVLIVFESGLVVLDVAVLEVVLFLVEGFAVADDLFHFYL